MTNTPTATLDADVTHGRTFRARTQLDLMLKVYRHHGWSIALGLMAAKFVEFYEMTTDHRKNQYVATPRHRLASTQGSQGREADVPQAQARVLAEAFEQAHALIQEAKGADGPNGGFVTDHLDFAENWLWRAEDETHRLLAMADAAVTFALDLGCGYPTPEMDAGIRYVQERGFDRWSMQAQMDAAPDREAEAISTASEGEVEAAVARIGRQIDKEGGGGMTRPLSDGKRYMVIAFSQYEADLMNRYERGKNATASPKVASDTAPGAIKTMVGHLHNRANFLDRNGYDGTAVQLREAADMIEHLAALSATRSDSVGGVEG